MPREVISLEGELLTKKEAAKLLRVGKRTFERYGATVANFPKPVEITPRQKLWGGCALTRSSAAWARAPAATGPPAAGPSRRRHHQHARSRPVDRHQGNPVPPSGVLPWASQEHDCRSQRRLNLSASR